MGDSAGSEVIQELMAAENSGYESGGDPVTQMAEVMNLSRVPFP